MLAWSHPYGLDVTLVDGDRISRSNCVRQPFSESEIGLYKAVVLATRINMFLGLGWKGSPQFLDASWREETDLVIGCVDSRKGSAGHYEYQIVLGELLLAGHRQQR
jgi:tRNA A37 threonylcarbamoyladenosine dehydratase